MTIQLIKRHQQWLVPVAIVLALAGLFVARTAFARITVNTIDPVGIVAHNGRHVTLTGPIAITAGERVQMRVTVTQRTTGAVAEGHAVFTGTGTTNQWEIEAPVEGDETFEAGPALAVALARSTLRGQATDAHQWAGQHHAGAGVREGQDRLGPHGAGLFPFTDTNAPLFPRPFYRTLSP